MGADVVEVRRMALSLRRSERLASYVFSEGERRQCAGQRCPEAHYALRFAAKEAFLKSLGLGLFDGVALSEIEVVPSLGAPRLRLGPSARAALAQIEGREVRLSLSLAAGRAFACVVVS